MVRHVLLALLVVVAGQQASDAKGVNRGTGALKTVQRLAPPLSFDRVGNAQGLPDSEVRAVVQDRMGFIWLGTQGGLARYDGTRMRVYRPTENDPTSVSGDVITALVLDASGKLWVGTAENGVNLYDPDTDRFTRFVKGAKGSVSSEGVTAIERDGKDRIWLAMSGGGLNRFDPATGTFAEYLSAPLDSPVTTIDSDKAGNLWLGTTREELIRWNPDDGSTETFRPQTGEDRKRGVAPITKLLISSAGKVWLGSDGDGLFEFDPATSKFVRQVVQAPSDPATLSDDHVRALFEDRHHNLWIGTTNGLNRMEPSGRLVQYHHDPNDPTSLASPGVEAIYQDAGGVMWIGGKIAGVCKFDELRLSFGHYRTQTYVANSYYEDPDGTLWVGTYNGGLYKYEWGPQRVTLHQSLGKPGEEGSVALTAGWISSLHRDRQGTLWIALMGQGLIAFDTKTEAYRQYLPDPETPNSLPTDTLFDIHEGEDGVLWLASTGGLVRFDTQLESFKAITSEDSVGLTSNYIYTLYPDPADKKILWLGTAKGGLVRFNVETGTGTSFRHHNEDPASLSNDDVLGIYRDPAGIVWAGTWGGGLNRLDPATGKAERFTTGNSGLTNDVVLGVLPDDDGNIWLSTNGGGLLQLDPKTRKILAYQPSDGAQDAEFGQGSFMRNKSGKLFFGGVGGFNAFMPRELVRDPYVPPVALTGFRVFNQELKLDRPIWTLPALEVSYTDSFEVQFAALSFAAPSKNRYAYMLEGFDDKFIETDRPYATYTKLDGGNYTLRVRASNQHGVWNETGIALKLSVTPPLWRTWPAFGLYGVLFAVAVFLFVRFQRQKVRRAVREGRLAVVERDLALTGAVQSGFLPENNEIYGANVQLCGFYQPADACSGDWWWHEALPNGRHFVMVGDVTGHGPGPAMVTASVATAFRVLTGSGLNDLKQGLELLNRVVLHVAKGKYHMTMAALELDENTGEWALHSAGAPPLLSLNSKGKHRVHFCAGSPLGTETGFETGFVQGKLQPNDRLLLYTDGIPEITLPNGNVLGMRRFAQLYERTRAQSLRDSAAAIVQLANDTQAGEEQADDWTFTLLEYTGGRYG